MTTAVEGGGGPSPSLARLWAGWRTDYIARISTDDAEVRPDVEGRSLFERIFASGLPDDETFILWRGPTCFAVLNAFPYGSGHLMVLPQRARPDVGDLTAEESAELWEGVRLAVAAIRGAYSPDGINVGTDVRMAGVKVGTVTGFALNAENYTAHVTLALDSALKLTDDATAKVTAEGLLGSKFISLEQGGSDTLLASGDAISNTQGAVDIWSLISQAMFDRGGTKSGDTPPETQDQ